MPPGNFTCIRGRVGLSSITTSQEGVGFKPQSLRRRGFEPHRMHRDISTDWRNGSASDSSPEGYVFESRIGQVRVAGAAARSFPKLTRPPNAGGGAAMSKESVAEAK